MAKSRRMRHRRSRKGGSGDPITDNNTDTYIGIAALPGAENEGYMGSGCKRRHKTHRRGRRGGAGAADWIISNFGGTTEGQFMNTFGNGGPQTTSSAQIPTVVGAPAVGPNNIPQGTINPNSLVPQFGGKRRRAKKGGYWAQVLETALVPFGLLGLQNAYGKRTRKHRK